MGSSTSGVPSAKLAVAGEDNDLEDPDSQAVKYNKRLLNSKRSRTRPPIAQLAPLVRFSKSAGSLAVVVCLWLLLTVVFFVWQYSAHQTEERARIEREERQARAERIWKERHYDNPLRKEGYRPERQLELAFQEERTHVDEKGEMTLIRKLLHEWLEDLNQEILRNVKYEPRWVRPYLLPPLPDKNAQENKKRNRRRRNTGVKSGFADYFKVERAGVHMEWKREWDAMSEAEKARGPLVDYTDPNKYRYPPKQMSPPVQGGYPSLRTLEDIMKKWHQDQDCKDVITETLIHFNYSDPNDLAAATLFRDAALPFKLYDVPEITTAGEKWTDHYLMQNFGHEGKKHKHRSEQGNVLASGNAQESPNNFFAFLIPKLWDVDDMGLPPVRNNDWSFAEWAEHARYADTIGLSSGQPHFYWQSGCPPEERHYTAAKWTFITRDLREMSATNETFLVFHPDLQKGIQCRFGERGVVAATHYDGGRNMVAMITGAKRYILSPPNQCSKLGIFTKKSSPIYRHSLLNFGHIKYLKNDAPSKFGEMSSEERAWLQRAAASQAVETVLKAGEILYIPSHWFHYIISLQKSAQCNVRSGIDQVGTLEFGGKYEVETCKDD